MINNLDRSSFFSHTRDRASLFTLLVLFLLSFNAKAQGGGGQGNTTIFGGAQRTIFGNYDFSTGGGGVQPGVISARAQPQTTLGYLIFPVTILP